MTDDPRQTFDALPEHVPGLGRTEDQEGDGANEGGLDAAGRHRARVREAMYRRQGIFLEEFARTGVVTQAAAVAGVWRTRVYQWLDEDDGFRERFRRAEDMAADALEEEARRRAVDGWEEPVFYQGIECGAVRKFDAGLLTLLLKARRPEKFRDRVDHRHSGPGGGPIANSTEVKHVVDLDIRDAAILAALVDAGLGHDAAGGPDGGAAAEEQS